MTVNDTLPEEQLKKRKVIPEILDRKGLVQRSRVLEQSYFDRLLLAKRITLPQHSAAEEFAKALMRAGCYMRSPSLEPGVRTPSYMVGGRMSDKIMAMSRPLRAMRRAAGDEASNLVTSLIVLKDCSKYEISDRDLGVLVLALDSLVELYGISCTDPRDLI